jgi:uncharacterized protein (TIGR00369 family)
MENATEKMFQDKWRRIQEGSGPALQVPPNCLLEMEGRLLDYEPGRMLQAAFPASPRYANPMGTIQGGFIAAAFDNVLGPLSYLAAGRPCTTSSLSVNFIRAIRPGDEIRITARVISRSRQTLHLRAEAVNRAGKLAAVALTNLAVVKNPVASGPGGGTPPSTSRRDRGAPAP